MLRAIVADTRARVAAAAEEATRRPRLTTREQVTAPLAVYVEPRIRARGSEPIDRDRRAEFWGDALPEKAASRRIARSPPRQLLSD